MRLESGLGTFCHEAVGAENTLCKGSKDSNQIARLSPKHFMDEDKCSCEKQNEETRELVIKY